MRERSGIDKPVMHFTHAAGWEEWLAGHHEGDGVWLRIAKKGSPAVSVTAAEALQVALCYGWIDSRRESHDEHWFLQRYSRRRRGSPWSQVNVGHVESLIIAGRMRPPGLAEVAAAQADGRWASAYTAQRDTPLPADLAEALAACPEAAARFEALGRTARYHVVLPLLKTRTPAGRAARLRKTIADLSG
ncbi:YdeI/OmpD-associated family protein [Rhizohabitans arisaemae]|uniref:YdeI/OmpD-associated family protein n=1 Tax=Rhizohabitans arisaemae TaxID=2720610 RepID=UPI0024B05389|nr:YdeI/OmpD-associated family protein [Rhizohabitans arisaemae]